MIKLTLTPQTQPITYVFEKNCVIIGKISANGVPPDLALPCDGLETIHIKIEYSGSQFIALNSAEDPFATINQLPFSKKVIHSGDTLVVAGMTISFEACYQEEKSESNAPPEDDFLIAMLDNKIHKTHALADSFEIDRVMEDLETQLILPSISATDRISVERDTPDVAVGDEEIAVAITESDATDGGISLDRKLTERMNKTAIPDTESNVRQLELSHSSLAVSEISKTFFSNDELDALFLQVAELEKQHFYHARENENQQSEIQLQQPEVEPQQPDIQLQQPEVEPQQPDIQPQQLETQPHQPEFTELTQQKMPEPPAPQQRRSMKDDSSLETEEDTSKKNSVSSLQSVGFSTKALFTAIGAFILLMGIVFGCFYIAVTGHNEEKEIKAAQAVADVAMALNFAQINHAKAQNQNWSNPDFLKHNLAGVLASAYAPLAKVDSHGQLLSTSYILRIYTGSDDLKHFLIIAQPNPGILQWLVPKAAITVDSSFMELRKITDLKTLNRLLVNATLDTSNSADIANFVRLGELVPLVELKKYHPHTGFDIPKYLSFIHPGAENLIYNGTRYFPLGEALMRKAIAIYENEEYSNDVPALIDEINRFTRFPNLVLYSSDGIQVAQRGQKALAAFFPQYKFLHAYLQFNSQNFATNSYLLMDESTEELRILGENIEETQPKELEPVDSKEIAIGDNKDEMEMESPIWDEPGLANEFYWKEINRLASYLENKEKATAIKATSPSINDKEIDRYHPLYYKLKALAHAREKSLKLINDGIDREWGNSYKVARLREAYSQMIDDQQDQIVKGICALQKEYASMPLTKFMTYIRAAGLRPFIQENLRRQLNDINHAPFPEESMNTSIEKIRRSTNFQDLEKHLHETSLLLNLENFPDPALFITYQNEIHSTVIHKLDTFLLSSSSPQATFHSQDRAAIAKILKSAWITDQEEISQYLKEFDLLVAQ